MITCDTRPTTGARIMLASKLFTIIARNTSAGSAA